MFECRFIVEDQRRIELIRIATPHPGLMGFSAVAIPRYRFRTDRDGWTGIIAVCTRRGTCATALRLAETDQVLGVKGSPCCAGVVGPFLHGAVSTVQVTTPSLQRQAGGMQ